MSAEYVRDYYGVTYKRGDRVTIDGRPGTIVSFPGHYLGVRFDGETRTSRCHPTWRVRRDGEPPLSAGEEEQTCTGCGEPVDRGGLTTGECGGGGGQKCGECFACSCDGSC